MSTQREQAQLTEPEVCPGCGRVGTRSGSVNVRKWRTLYRCPACGLLYYTFKGVKQNYYPPEEARAA